MKRKLSQEEKKYLESYDISKFERPSIAADIVVFSILNDGVRDSIRRLQKKSLQILLVKRADYPYKDYWALPGGFCMPGEDVIETAARELLEETNVNNAYLKLVDVYGDKDRDPRGWIVSNTFMALIDGEKSEPKPGTDTGEAKWFTLELTSKLISKEVKKKQANIITDYELSFRNDEIGKTFTCSLSEKKVFKDYHEHVTYEIKDSGLLAFDHAKIIMNAIMRLRKETEFDFRVAFDLVPENFTLTYLQTVYELIWDKKLITANFRRKILDYVRETEESIEGEGFRPAKLFERNLEKFY